MHISNTTNVAKLGRWKRMTEDRAIFELLMMQSRKEYDRACKQFDCLCFAAALFIAVGLSYIVATLP